MTNPSKPCKRCGEPKARGRSVYCGDECAGLALRDRHDAKKAKRMQACKRCGGPKELGLQGRGYCDECRRVIADSSASHESERGRRRHLAAMAARDEKGIPRRRRSDAAEGQKWCARCQQFRSIGSFARNKDKPSAYCIPCQRAYNQERRLLKTYGITWDEYDFLLSCQDGRCAICQGKPRKYALAVDHDHKTGEIRGLLCSKCNHKLLGSANDDPARLRRAADYLEEFSPREVFGAPKFAAGYGSTP